MVRHSFLRSATAAWAAVLLIALLMCAAAGACPLAEAKGTAKAPCCPTSSSTKHCPRTPVVKTCPYAVALVKAVAEPERPALQLGFAVIDAAHPVLLADSAYVVPAAASLSPPGDLPILNRVLRI
jgi:hypothetical protein